MEAYKKLTIMAMVLVAALLAEPMTANSMTLCGVSTDGLMKCKPAVAKGVNPLPLPTTACCSALSSADMKCLCQYKESSLLPSLGIDPDLAMQLPEKCNLPQASFHC